LAVHEDDGVVLLARHLDRFAAVARELDVEAELAQNLGGGELVDLVVFCDERETSRRWCWLVGVGLRFRLEGSCFSRDRCDQLFIEACLAHRLGELSLDTGGARLGGADGRRAEHDQASRAYSWV
jgi:hypothetical protein